MRGLSIILILAGLSFTASAQAEYQYQCLGIAPLVKSCEASFKLPAGHQVFMEVGREFQGQVTFQVFSQAQEHFRAQCLHWAGSAELDCSFPVDKAGRLQGEVQAKVITQGLNGLAAAGFWGIGYERGCQPYLRPRVTSPESLEKTVLQDDAGIC